MNPILCSFCSKNFASSEDVREHLVECGNRPDQCPTCRRFIRRAIFAYHYENNCTDLDDSITTDDPYPSQSKDYELKISKLRICEYCNGECPDIHYEVHKERCLCNPLNVKDNQTTNETKTSNRNRIRQNSDIINNTVYIPCQFCQHSIESKDLTNHQTRCRWKLRHIRDQLKEIRIKNSVAPIRCKNCRQKMSRAEFENHQMNCTQKVEKRSYVAVLKDNHLSLHNN